MSFFSLSHHATAFAEDTAVQEQDNPTDESLLQIEKPEVTAVSTGMSEEDLRVDISCEPTDYGSYGYVIEKEVDGYRDVVATYDAADSDADEATDNCVYIDSDVDPDQTYTYYVTAFDENGYSSDPAKTSITTKLEDGGQQCRAVAKLDGQTYADIPSPSASASTGTATAAPDNQNCRLVLAKSDDATSGTANPNGAGSCQVSVLLDICVENMSLPEYLALLTTKFIPLLFVLAIILIAISGVQYMLGGLNADNKKKARLRIVSVVVGIVFFLSISLILRLLFPSVSLP